MTLTLPDALIEEGRVVYDASAKTEEALCWWLASVVEEIGVARRPELLGILARAWAADYDLLRSYERIGRMWPRELRNSFAEVPISVLRLCIKDEMPDEGLAAWCQDNHASYSQCLDEKRRREGRDPVAVNLAGFITKARKWLTGWTGARRDKALRGVELIQEALQDV